MRLPHSHFLPTEQAALLGLLENAEPWVIAGKKRNGPFGEKLKRLYDMLLTGRITISDDEFLEKFVVVAAYSSFEDNLALLYALRLHPRLFNRTILGGPPIGPAECWGALRWRIRYLTVYSTLTRVFSDTRFAMIKSALIRAGTR
jgi:hypothetical protein